MRKNGERLEDVVRTTESDVKAGREEKDSLQRVSPNAKYVSKYEWKRKDRNLAFLGDDKYDGPYFPATICSMGTWYSPNAEASIKTISDVFNEWKFRNTESQKICHTNDMGGMVYRNRNLSGDQPCSKKMSMLWDRLERMRRRVASERVRNYVPPLSSDRCETTDVTCAVHQLMSSTSERRKLLQPMREIRIFDRNAKRLAHARTQELHKRYTTFLDALFVHAKKFESYHKSMRKKVRRLARDVRSTLQTRERQKHMSKERQERQRLKALRENDMEAYMKLVESTKNKRLHHLLHETETFLKNLGQLIVKQKGAVSLGKRDKHTKARCDDDENDATCTPEEQDIDSDRFTGETYYRMAHSNREASVRQPQMLVGGTLKDYQLQGLDWLVSLYENNLNGILADEMGLGKTIQTISLLCYLSEVMQNNGPFLICVPLSTLSNWHHELRKWAPNLDVVVYKGIPEKRKEIYRNEMRQGTFNVLLTTYEYVMRDRRVLKRTTWQYIIVDEGHRMKNAKCKFSQILGHDYKSQHRLLLTGTPLQNSLPELWSLLNFLLPHIFHSVDNFERWFNKPFENFGSRNDKVAHQSTINEEEKLLIIHRLHQILRPFLLRRVKTDVLDQLPQKVERVLKCELSAWQTVLYRQIQSTGHAIMNSGDGRRASSRGLSNVLMQLRKVCNHPYLFSDAYDIDRNIMRASGKVELLDRILLKQKATGHRVLIFSQMTKTMDILEHYFRWRNFAYLRLDGSTKIEDRDLSMRKFNEPDSPYFIFLLSTRAGGLGINLATADTVVIFDSDWNPAMDKQAQDRAHRIGQQREVRVLRLITNTPVEEKMLLRATSKMGMEKVVIQSGKFVGRSRGDKDMIREILKESQEMIDAERNRDEIPDDDAINKMIARDADEIALFAEMDAQRIKEELVVWKKLNPDASRDGSSPPSRLMELEELPSWLTEDPTPSVVDTISNEVSGKRRRANPYYGDLLTERQWDRLYDEGATEQEIEAAAESRRKKLQGKAKKRKISVANLRTKPAPETPSTAAE